MTLERTRQQTAAAGPYCGTEDAARQSRSSLLSEMEELGLVFRAGIVQVDRRLAANDPHLQWTLNSIAASWYTNNTFAGASMNEPHL